jgi:hypothetical protein
MKKSFKKLFKRLSDDDSWLGYKKIQELWKNTIYIFSEQANAFFATRTPIGTWVVWTDANLLSQKLNFDTWNDAILYLQNKFQTYNHQLKYWNPNIPKKGDDLFLNEPDFNIHQFKDWFEYFTEDEMWDNTICVILEPPDAGWFATRTPNGIWIVWNDANLLPQSLFFPTWKNAVFYLWSKFQKSKYPLDHWNPDDFDREDDLLSKEPDLKKYI